MDNVSDQQLTPLPETPPPPKSKKWLIIIFGVILTFLISIIGFLVYQNYQLKKALEAKPSPSSIPFPSPTPTPQAEKEIKIIGDNIFRVKASGETEILVNINDPVFTTDFIVTLSEVQTSPDKSKICFVGMPPAPDPLVYYSDLNSGEIFKVGWGKNCFWSPDSQKIAFNNYATDVSPVNIFVYDLLSKESRNLTKDAAGEGFIRYYDPPEWIDNTKILTKFTSVDMPNGTSRTEGTSIINVSTGEIVDN